MSLQMIINAIVNNHRSSNREREKGREGEGVHNK